MLFLLQGGAAHPARSVEGKVLRPGAHDMYPVPGVWVTLHRVGTDHAAPLDSMRTNAKGEYAFKYNRTGSEDAIYFASASHSGIAYFTSPFNSSKVDGPDAEIVVFDTTSKAVKLSVRGHHMVISSTGADGKRTITEVFELSNDTSVTFISPSDDRPTFSSILPDKASNFLINQGDIPSDAVKFADGRASVFAPFSPGVKQLAYTYSLPAEDFPLSLPSQYATVVYEVLIEDPSGSVKGANLREVTPVTIEGRNFRRFLGSNVAANSVTDVVLPKPPKTLQDSYVLIIVAVAGVAMIFALARAFKKR